MHKYLAFLLLASTLADCSPLTSMVPVENRTLDSIYQAALKESGTLRVAWGGDIQASGQAIKSTFENAYPGITLDLNLDVSKYLDSQIDLAYGSSNGDDNGADVAVLQSLQDFTRWKSEGRLLPYKVAQWDDIYSEFVDPDATYTGLYMFSFGHTVYNSNVTSNSSLPKTYTDYLDPQWHGKIILTYPNDDDAILFLFSTIIDKYGFDYIHSLQAQQPQWVRGTATPSVLISPAYSNNSVTTNSQSISFASSSAFAQGVASQDSQDVYITWPQTGAIFSSTKVPETARLFLGFLLSDQWQQLVSENRFATRRSYDKVGVFNQSGIDPLAYGRFMADRQQVEAFRFSLESVLGPPVGADPVTEY